MPKIPSKCQAVGCDYTIDPTKHDQLVSAPIYADTPLDRFGCGTGEEPGIEAWVYLCEECSEAERAGDEVKWTW